MQLLYTPWSYSFVLITSKFCYFLLNTSKFSLTEVCLPKLVVRFQLYETTVTTRARTSIYSLICCYCCSGRSISQKQGNGRQHYTSCCVDLEILIDYVEGVEILLAQVDPIYASRALHWHCIFWIGAYLIICSGKLIAIKTLSCVLYVVRACHDNFLLEIFLIFLNTDLFIVMQTRVAAIFAFVSFTSILSIAGVPAQMKEIKVIPITFS